MRCMIVDCPCCNPEHLCDEHEIFYRGYCPLCYEEEQKSYYTDEDE